LQGAFLGASIGRCPVGVKGILDSDSSIRQIDKQPVFFKSEKLNSVLKYWYFSV